MLACDPGCGIIFSPNYIVLNLAAHISKLLWVRLLLVVLLNCFSTSEGEFQASELKYPSDMLEDLS